MPKETRIDKWLWAMRIFKTRVLATDACRKGRVTIGTEGQLIKPSRTVKAGDIVNVRKPPVTYTFRVLDVTENRLGARLVPDYCENITPQSQYELLDMVKISGFIDRRKGLGRPTKKEGRDLQQFTSEAFDTDFLFGWDDGEDEDEDEDEDEQ